MRPLSSFGRQLRPTRALGICALVAGLSLALAAPALASKRQEEFLPFKQCETATSAVCIVSFTTSGEFHMGSKNVPINKTLELQGGLPSSNILQTWPLIGAKNGETLVPTALTLPGGLTGVEALEALGSVNNVTATAELAGPASDVLVNQVNLVGGKGIGVKLPLKVHLQNELLGNECYIGTEAEPLVLELTTGTTSPPSPNAPITGNKGEINEVKQPKNIITVKNIEMVDNSFAAPGVTGCGPSLLQPVVNALVDVAAGLPSAAGNNTVRMKGYSEIAEAPFVAKYDKEKKAKKTKGT